MNGLARLGVSIREGLRRHGHLAAVASAVLRLSVSPRRWPRTVRAILARQILFTGFEALRLVALVAVVMGVAVVLQTQVWLTKFGQSAFIGPILVAVIIRELGPLLVNFVVIGRSGTAISSELSSMRVAGEIRVLDSMGLDPLATLVLPRCIGVAVSVFCLAVLFVAVSFVSGYLAGLLLGANVGTPGLFADSVLRAIRPADIVNLSAKTLLPGVLTGAICCIEGLGVRGALTEIPQAASRGVVRSVAALFVVSILVSLLTYA
jgi:phospholipid/cholesterol/gamma-HCH transport system permease protein